MEKLKSGAQKLGIELTHKQLEKFQRYYDELISWNRKINLTAITDDEGVQLRHFLDSLSLVPEIPAPAAGKILRLIDIGTGAGLPGIPLKIVLPYIELVLLEATAKKVKFLEHMVAALGLGGVTIASGRAEELAHRKSYREAFDVVVGRAVAALPVLAELALPFCRVGGCFLAPKKGDISAELEKSHRVLAVMGGKLRMVKPVVLEGLGEARCLVIVDKISPTPPQYPRRPGMPQKRPLSL